MTQETVTELGPDFVSRKQHLMQRGNRWYYNRAWPSDLTGTLGAAPFRKSLRTDSLAEAIRAKGEAEREYWARVDGARAPQSARATAQPDESQAHSLAVQWFREGLSEMEELLSVEQGNPERLEVAIATALEIIPDLRRELAEEQGGPKASQIARGLAERAGYSQAGLPLIRSIQRAQIAWYEVWQGRLVSDYSARPSDPLFAAAMEAPQGAPQAQSSEEPGRTLGDLIAALKEAKWDDLKPAGRAAYETAFRTLRDLLGEGKPVASVSRDDARRVFDAMKRLPKGYGTAKKWEGLDTLGAIAKADREGLPRISPATVNRDRMGMLASLFGWALTEGWTASNPFRGLRVKDREAARDKRDAFSSGQLSDLFAGSPWAPRVTSPPTRYWFPLFALFQGMRLAEIAQLRTADFRSEDGVYLFEVRGDLKNVNARRTLPLHPELQRLGILALVERRKKAGREYLFDAGPDKRGKWGVSESRWFGRLVKQHGIEGRGLGLHSFRHSFQDALRRAELHQTAIGAALAGRKGGDPVADAYGRGFSPRQLGAAIAKISYPGLPLISGPEE